jgi:hypothetical protein
MVEPSIEKFEEKLCRPFRPDILLIIRLPKASACGLSLGLFLSARWAVNDRKQTSPNAAETIGC